MLIKLCRNCSYIRLLPSELLGNNFRNAKCTKFGKTINKISGEIIYPSCEKNRNDLNLCGMEGKYHTQSFVLEK